MTFKADKDVSIDILSDITIYNKYAKYKKDEGRRESWFDIVERNKEMHLKKYPFLKDELDYAYEFVHNKLLLPSMRSAQFAGRPIEVNNSRIYNCAFVKIDNIAAFSETMFLLLSGCGVGFSVQKTHIDKLPTITKPTHSRKYLIADSIEGWADAVKVLIKAYFAGGYLPRFDYSDIREKGAELVTSGGKAPGPDPLHDCLHKINKILNNKIHGSKLLPIEAHDIICYLADAVLAGGIRRAATLSLFSLDDENMLTSKFGEFWELHPERSRANNSAGMVRGRITKEIFFNTWDRVVASGTGDPGLLFTNDPEYGTNPCKPLYSTILTPKGYITFEEALKRDSLEIVGIDGKIKKASKPFKTGENQQIYEVVLSNGIKFYSTANHLHMLYENNKWIRMDQLKVGDKLKFVYDENPTINAYFSVEAINPNYDIQDVYDITVYDDTHAFVDSGVVAHNCGEIALRSEQFCNLATINASNLGSQKDFNERSRVAAFIATLQAGYTDFHYLRDSWKRNTEKDALIGVSLTGIADGVVTSLDLTEAANCVLESNEMTAAKIGINKAARTTCVKPEGTGSLVLGCASGISARHSPYYVRRMRLGKNESLYNYLAKYHPELVEDEFLKPQTQAVVSVPQRSPEGSIFRDESALDFLERVKEVNLKWVYPGHRSGPNKNNVSATVPVKDNEWDEVGEWMWANRDSYAGITVLPYDGGNHKQAPFEEIDKETFDRMFQTLKEVDLTNVYEYEDNTNLNDQAACAGGVCEIT